MPFASAAALAPASRDVQIATTSTPSTARHAGRWHLTPQFALMMPTFRERAVIGWACALCRPSARRAADAMIELTYRQLCGIINQESAMIDAAMLADIEEIKQLKSRYFYHLDHKEWDGWRENVFCRDASMHVPEAQLELFGLDNILACLKTLLADVVTVHHGHMPLIQILSPTTASGIWAMED